MENYNQIKEQLDKVRKVLSDNQTLNERKDIKSLYGIKSKCQINIVPKKNNSKSLKIDKTCILKLK